MTGTGAFKNEHAFTRDGVSYACVARPERKARSDVDDRGDFNEPSVNRAGDADEVRHATEAIWYVTADGREVPSINVTFTEFESAENLQDFEDAIVRDATGAE